MSMSVAAEVGPIVEVSPLTSGDGPGVRSSLGAVGTGAGGVETGATIGVCEGVSDGISDSGSAVGLLGFPGADMLIDMLRDISRSNKLVIPKATGKRKKILY